MFITAIEIQIEVLLVVTQRITAIAYQLYGGRWLSQPRKPQLDKGFRNLTEPSLAFL